MEGSSYKASLDACEWYDFPQNKELDWFVELSGKALPTLKDVENPREHILGLANRMERAVNALAVDEHFFGEKMKAARLHNGTICLRSLVDKFNRPALRGHEADAWRQFDSLYLQCIKAAAPFGGSGGSDIMGYRWSNMYPEPSSAPNWDYYRNTVTKIRGGEPRNFSSLTFMGKACKAYQALYPEVYGDVDLEAAGWTVRPQEGKLKHLTYISDGLCGSTCSVSSTRPYLEGLSTFVTFGGIPGQPMDITSFNGGNVASYQVGKSTSYSLWKDALDTIADASVFFPEEEPQSWPFLPIPLNIYKARFSQRAEYVRTLGPKALPREWYLIPASYHLDIWTVEPLNRFQELSANGRRKLFEIYVATAALPPKPLVRAAG